MRRKLFISIALLCAVSFSKINAEDFEKAEDLEKTEDFQKTVVFIDYFTYPSSVNAEYAEALRSKVIEGIHTTGRLQVIDIASEEKLNNEEERRKAESAMADATARISQMNTLGANHIVTGEITSINTTKVVSEKDGKISYNGNVQWNIKVIDAATGTLQKAANYEHKGSGETPQKAIMGACNQSRGRMKSLTEDVFPLVGRVLRIETVNKKRDKAETVVINLGTSHGIKKGQRMTVFAEINIAGEVGQKEIGTLNANEVVAPGRTICKVSSGGDQLLKAINNKQKVLIKSRENKLFEF